MKFRKKYPNIVLILTGLSFLASGFDCIENNLKILHPFIPFLTEDIWQYIDDRKPSEALIISTMPISKKFNEQIVKEFEFASEVISGIRNIRMEKNLSLPRSLEPIHSANSS